MQFFDTGYTYITDTDGMVIGYNKVPDLVGVMNISQPTIPQFNDEPIDPALNKLFADAMSANAQASGTWKMPDGTSFFSVATPFDVEGTQWCVISAAPTRSASSRTASRRCASSSTACSQTSKTKRSRSRPRAKSSRRAPNRARRPRTKSPSPSRTSLAASKIRRPPRKTSKKAPRASRSSAQTAHIVASAQGVKDQVTSGRNSINEAVEQMQQITKSTESIQASIGKLSESGKKISQMVANNHTDMEATVTACNEGAESIRAGIQTVHDADDVFEKMVTTIDELVVGINAVADAIRQMETQNESMLTASQNISATGRKNSDEAQSVSAATEEQTASMHEIATASGSLAKLAANLQAEIEKFRL